MKKDLESFMMELDAVTPPEDLNHSIFVCIAKEEKRLAKIRFMFLGGISLASFIGIVTSLLSLSKQFAGSDFGQYLSLIASDKTILISYWKEISFSLVESLPLFGVALLLSGIGIFIWSLAKAIRNVEIIKMAV